MGRGGRGNNALNMIAEVVTVEEQSDCTYDLVL